MRSVLPIALHSQRRKSNFGTTLLLPALARPLVRWRLSHSTTSTQNDTDLRLLNLCPGTKQHASKRYHAKALEPLGKSKAGKEFAAECSASFPGYLAARKKSGSKAAALHMTRALLLPIKDLRNAKQRLASVLTPEERFSLAEAMLEDTVLAIGGVTLTIKTFVVTNYAPAIEIAERYGWEVLREEKQVSESVSVDFASRLCAERGITGLLRLPLDLPLVQSSDIDELLAIECAAPAVVLVPSRDGTGTNAILRTPPALFPSHFGPDSFAKHRREAEQAGARIILRRNVRLEMDVDNESDLRALLQLDLRHTATGKWLEQSGVAARFRQRRIGAIAADAGV